MKYLFNFCILSLLCCSFVHGQDSTKVKLYGKVVSGSSPLYNVTIANTSKNTGTVSGVTGDFAVLVEKGDVIRFSSIGYKAVSYKVPDTLAQNSFRILVNLVADTIYLKEAVIVPWPVNTTMLKEAMLEKRPEENRISSYAGFVEIEGDPAPPAPKFYNPISFLISKVGKKARQQRKMEKYRKALQETESIQDERLKQKEIKY